MSGLFRFSIYLVLGLAATASIYLYGSLSDENVTSAPPKPEAPIASVAPEARAEVLAVEELADYLIARQNGSLEGWRAFLTNHGSGLHAQSARAEFEKLLHAEQTPAPAIAEVLPGASPDAPATSEAAPSPATEAAASPPDEICKRDEERLERLRSSPLSEEAARFANELGCEKLRPQLLGLMESSGNLAATPAIAEVSPGASPAAPSPATEAAASPPDEICKRDEERLERLRSSPSSEEAARFANELGCEKLRPQLLGLMESSGNLAATPAIAEVSPGASPDAPATSEAARPAAPSPATEAAPPPPDEICKRDEERLERLRSSPSSEEAARFANELGCEKLRPQLLGLMESSGNLAATPAIAEVSPGASPDAPATSEAARPAAPSPATEAAASPPDEICKRDEERLERLRSSPSSGEAARFANELGCEKLRPQLLGLMASQSPSAKGSSALGLKAASDCVSERDRLDRIRAQPSADTAQQFWRDLQCDRLRPQVRLLLESLNLAADPLTARPAAPSPATEAAPSPPDEICKRDEERLERLRSSPSSEEAARFANELGCEKLRPQLLGLMASQSPSVKGSSALGLKAASDCVSERDRLDRIRAQPSADTAQQFWRDLQCDRLRPQVRLLLESLNLAADPLTARPAPPSPATEAAPSPPDEICKRDEERLERLRSSPSSEEAARFANELGCEKLRPQLLGLMASQSPSVKGSSALGLKAASDCVSERDRLDRIRAQPSADTAQLFWRDLQCDRLRPQVRLLLESLNLAADPLTACRREAEELNRIRTNPNRREAESFARDMTCNVLKPQAARLLESLAE